MNQESLYQGTMRVCAYSCTIVLKNPIINNINNLRPPYALCSSSCIYSDASLKLAGATYSSNSITTVKTNQGVPSEPVIQISKQVLVAPS